MHSGSCLTFFSVLCRMMSPFRFFSVLRIRTFKWNSVYSAMFTGQCKYCRTTFPSRFFLVIRKMTFKFNDVYLSTIFICQQCFLCRTIFTLWNNLNLLFGPFQNNVYVYNTQMVQVGKLEGLAPGERIYSCRFAGERGYLVTFRQARSHDLNCTLRNLCAKRVFPCRFVLHVVCLVFCIQDIPPADMKKSCVS